MTSRDPDLDRLFDTLPRETADPQFTDNVLRELDHRRARPYPVRRKTLALAVSAIGVAALVSVVWHVTSEKKQERLEQELQAIRAEYQTLARQLDELNREAEDSAVIYVGSDEQADYVLDLSELKERLGQTTQPAVAPVEQGVVGKRSGWPSHDPLPAAYQGGPI